MRPRLKAGYTKNGIRHIGYQDHVLREYCPFITMTSIYSRYGQNVCVGSAACQECEFCIENPIGIDIIKCKLFQIQENGNLETIIKY